MQTRFLPLKTAPKFVSDPVGQSDRVTGPSSLFSLLRLYDECCSKRWLFQVAWCHGVCQAHTLGFSSRFGEAASSPRPGQVDPQPGFPAATEARSAPRKLEGLSLMALATFHVRTEETESGSTFGFVLG